jgi:cell division protein FtsW
MAKRQKQFNTALFWIIASLALVGALAFLSSSFVVLVESKRLFTRMLLNHLGLGLIGGTLLAMVAYKVPLGFWKKASFPMLFVSILLTLLVFVPALGLTHGGATRWISLGFISFQPAELLKFSLVIFYAAFLVKHHGRVGTIKYGLLPVGLLLALVGGILLLQPDTGTFLVLAATICAMYFLAGAKLKHFGLILLGGLLLVGGLVATRPYLVDRVKTFIDPSLDPLGSSYQVRQSLITMGSGQTLGRGYGKSIQKFDYLPEPLGDSIFSVIGEEFGFVGSMSVVFLYIAFLFQGLKVSFAARDSFSRYAGIGIVSVISLQAIINIASIVGVMPLTGLPLPFMSQGGTSLMIMLIASGVLLRISRYGNIETRSSSILKQDENITPEQKRAKKQKNAILKKRTVRVISKKGYSKKSRKAGF